MLRTLLALAVVLALGAYPAAASTIDKDGTPAVVNPSSLSSGSSVDSDWEYNTGGTIDFVPDTGGSATGWGEWFIATVQNNTGNTVTLEELGFPCCGPTTGTYGWIVWVDVGGLVPPSGPASTAEYYGTFTPVDPGPGTFPPTVYTYVDVSSWGIAVPDGAYLCWGYDNTDTGGQTTYNGVTTWAWYGGIWDPDPPYGRTAILQVKGSFGPIANEQTTWGQIKDLYR